MFGAWRINVSGEEGRVAARESWAEEACEGLPLYLPAQTMSDFSLLSSLSLALSLSLCSLQIRLLGASLSSEALKQAVIL